MKVGLQVPNFTWPGGPETIRPTLAEIAGAVEEAEFYSMWVMDHFFQIPHMGPVDTEMMESYSTLGYLAGVTQQVKLGALVTGGNYRHPGLLVKTVTTLDVLSGGRAYFGIGTGWFEREALGLGAPFPSLKERFARLEEILQLTLQMWSDDDGAYSGRHFQLAETLCKPQPITRPHPPILIGGGGEQKTLRLVAQYADACNLYARLGPAVLGAKLDVLKRHCEKVGRDYAQIEKTALRTVNIVDGAADGKKIVAECRVLAGLGIQHCIFNMPNVHEIEPLRVFGREIIPLLREL